MAPRGRTEGPGAVQHVSRALANLTPLSLQWSGFDNFYYLFTYEDSRDLFSIPYDIQILQEVFRVPAAGESDTDLNQRPLYNRTNKFFTAKSFADLAAELEDESDRKKWMAEIERVKQLYGQLSATYQEAKAEGVATASVWK